jgi:hypothetical protein
MVQRLREWEECDMTGINEMRLAGAERPWRILG